METSLRYERDYKALRIHAKEKFPIPFPKPFPSNNTFLQVHGELDTRVGAPSYLCAMIRHFLPHLNATAGVGIQYDKHQNIRYVVRGNKSFPVTADGLINFNVKGWTNFDNHFKQRNSKGAAELSWSKFGIYKQQDVRLKVGYDLTNKVSYLQIKENNWTLNAYINGKWSIRFDL